MEEVVPESCDSTSWGQRTRRVHLAEILSVPGVRCRCCLILHGTIKPWSGPNVWTLLNTEFYKQNKMKMINNLSAGSCLSRRLHHGLYAYVFSLRASLLLRSMLWTLLKLFLCQFELCFILIQTEITFICTVGHCSFTWANVFVRGQAAVYGCVPTATAIFPWGPSEMTRKIIDFYRMKIPQVPSWGFPCPPLQGRQV